MIGKAVDDFQEYSYQYNLKIVGIPELNSRESASESSLHRLNLFNEIGAEVSPHDIDYAHRILTRTANAGPRPIIYRFTRRLVKENVMLRRKDACKTDPIMLGLTNQVSIEAVRIFDHRSPKMQQVLFDAKRFKEQHHFQFSGQRRRDGCHGEFVVRKNLNVFCQIFVEMLAMHPLQAHKSICGLCVWFILYLPNLLLNVGRLSTCDLLQLVGDHLGSPSDVTPDILTYSTAVLKSIGKTQPKFRGSYGE